MNHLNSKGMPRVTAKDWLRIVTPGILTLIFFGLIIYMFKTGSSDVVTGCLTVLTGLGAGISWAKALSPNKNDYIIF